MNIRMKSGGVLDLVKVRDCALTAMSMMTPDDIGREPGMHMLAILDALESALSIPHEVENMNEGVFGYNLALDRVHDVAGLVED